MQAASTVGPCSRYFSALTRLPCAILSKLWQIATKISYYIRYGTTSPFARTADEEANIRALFPRFVSFESTLALRSPSAPLLSSPDLQNLGRATRLTVEPPADRSKELTRFQVLMKQLVTTIGVCLIETSESTIGADQREAFVHDLGKICDIVSDFAASKIQSITMSDLVRCLLEYAKDEANAHVQAKGSPLYQKELKRFAEAKGVVDDYTKIREADTPKSQYSEAEYTQALQFLDQMARDGARFLLQEVYWERYSKILQGRGPQELAHREALSAREQKKAALGDNFCNLTEEEKEQSRQFYLDHLYVTAFLQQPFYPKGGLTELQSNDALDIDRFLSIEFKIAGSILHDVLPLLQPICDKIHALELRSDFLKNLLSTFSSLVSSSSNNKLFTDVLIINFLKLTPILDKLVQPQRLNDLFCTKIYPALQKELLKILASMFAVTAWDEMAPLYYAYDVTEDELDRMRLTNTIQDKLFNFLAQSSAHFLVKGAEAPFQRPHFKEVVESYLISHRKKQPLMEWIVTEMCKDPKERDVLSKEFHHLVTAAQEEEEKRQTRARIKSVIYNTVPKDFISSTSDPMAAFSHTIDPLITNIEQCIQAAQKNCSDKEFDLAAVALAFDGFFQKSPPAVTFPFGDLIVNILSGIGEVAPWLFTLLNWTALGYLKETIDRTLSRAITPYTVSHHKVIQQITEALQEKLCYPDHAVDVSKVHKLVFEKKEAPVPKPEKELALIAQELFQLSMIGVETAGYGERAQSLVKRVILGSDPDHAGQVLRRIHRAFFGMRMINLIRVETLFRRVLPIIVKSQNSEVRIQNSEGPREVQ